MLHYDREIDILDHETLVWTKFLAAFRELEFNLRNSMLCDVSGYTCDNCVFVRLTGSPCLENNTVSKVYKLIDKLTSDDIEKLVSFLGKLRKQLFELSLSEEEEKQ